MHYVPWYVAWAPTLENGRLGWYLEPPHPQLAVGQKAAAFCRREHRTVRCTTGHVLCSVRCTPRQPTVGGCSSRPLDPTVAVCPVHTGQSGATARERLSSASLRTLSGVTPDSPVHTGQQCPVRHRALADSLFLGFLRWFLRASITLESWTSLHLFMSSFEVLHPHCLSPILIASCELQTQTLESLLVHGLCWSSNTKTHLAKWPGSIFLTISPFLVIDDNTTKASK
jgi:hypothetical protein